MGYFISIFLSTFILEDVALATSIGLMNTGAISFYLAFMACFLGIALGDLGLYLLGQLASRFEGVQNISFLKKHKGTLSKIRKSGVLTYSIVISRIVPGTRLPTYLAAGFLRYSFMRFLFLTITSVFAWVMVALLAGQSLHTLFMDHWFYSIATFILGVQIFKSIIPQFFNPWDRKAFFQSWRKYAYFEFWPAWFFYLPIVPFYIYQALRYKSVFMPFYASPEINHGGLIGESKWDFLNHLKPSDSSTLNAIKVNQEVDFMELRKQIDHAELSYPLIIKPDVGQRGFGVRIIRDDFELTEYLLYSDFDLIVQKLSLYQEEAGIFYVRLPSENKGKLFSITNKKFPFVIGDGITKLGDLILRDPRARMIASVYFTRLKDRLDQIPILGERVLLSECGNHCQGAIFLNGKELYSEKLRLRFDEISKTIPNFYFGRFDIRYQDQQLLREGKNFEIVEVNGSGSEATHIWDARTSLREAYQTLFQQWALLFEIGAQVQKRTKHKIKINLPSFLKECFKVFFRKSNLSVSS